MKPSEMEAVFKPVVEHVIKLVWDQIQATNVKIKAVLLVGGFGQSSHLKDRLRSALVKRDKKNRSPAASARIDGCCSRCRHEGPSQLR
jgi:hypothetical protein